MLTGVAGFIGANLAERLLAKGHMVIGVDNFSDYYDVALKKARYERFARHQGFVGIHADIADKTIILDAFERHRPTHVINLAAQAGVRYSLKEPFTYVHSNVTGFLTMLEAARAFPVQHFIFASSSSVYGANKLMPYSEHNSTEHPLSLYAATKKANELMAHTYAYLFGIACTGLRFFTVYGPWGRPDMAPMLFTKAMLAGEHINVFNNGDMQRDFTYIDDVSVGIQALLDRPPSPNPAWDPDHPDPATSGLAPYQILNVGKNQPAKLLEFISILETRLGHKAKLNMMPMQDGDVPVTWADSSKLMELTSYRPDTTLEQGIAKFVDWYREYFDI